MVSDQEVLDNIKKSLEIDTGESTLVYNSLAQAEQKLKDLIRVRQKIGDLAQSMKDTYLQFANLLAVEIGKLNQLTPEELDISIMINGNIIISSGKKASFRLEFKNYNELLEYLLCTVRLKGIQDGAAVVSGEKTQAQVYHEVEQDYGSKCVSCGARIPPLGEDDDPSIKVCEKCYQAGET